MATASPVEGARPSAADGVSALGLPTSLSATLANSILRMVTGLARLFDETVLSCTTVDPAVQQWRAATRVRRNSRQHALEFAQRLADKESALLNPALADGA